MSQHPDPPTALVEILPTPPQPARLWLAQSSGYRPTGPAVLTGEVLWLAVEDTTASPPAGAAIIRLRLVDGRQAQAPIHFSDVLISGIHLFETPDSPLLLVATYSLDLLQAEGTLVALDMAGQERWRWLSGAASVSAPAGVGDTVWVTTNTGDLVSLAVADGKEQTRLALGITPALAAPLIHHHLAYVPCRGPRLLAVGLAGQNGWQFEAPEANAWLNHTPVVMGEQIITVFNQAGRVAVLRQDDGHLVWETQVGPVGKPLSPPVNDGRHVYVGTREGLYALNPVDGQVVWHFAVKRGLEAAPVVVDDTVYITCRNRHLYALDVTKGQAVWHYGVERRIQVSPLIATGASSLALIADHGGTITAVQRPRSAAEYEAEKRWLEAASVYAAQDQVNRAAELLAAHAEPLKAAQLWHLTGDLAQAAGQYEAAQVWDQAAALWAQLNRPLKQAEALEQYAQSLVNEGTDVEQCAAAWEKAAQAFVAAGEPERAEACRKEVIRCRCLPDLEVKVEHKGLVLRQWTRLRFIIHNQGHGSAHQLIIRARGGQFEGQVADTRQIVTLRAGQTRQNQLDVRPLASGDSVPLRVSIDYQDEAGYDCTWQRTLYLAVAETRQALSKQPEPEPPLLPSNLDATRRRLNQQFDDPELDAFCMDHFPAVFDKFSRGLRKDEKINLLLDHCRREPEHYQQLLAALEELGK